MVIEFKLPEVSDGVTSVDIATIHVKAGDVVTKDQVVMELETEKAVVFPKSKKVKTGRAGNAHAKKMQVTRPTPIRKARFTQSKAAVLANRSHAAKQP